MKDMLGNPAVNLPAPGEEEIWKSLDFLGYPNYSVSSFGRVRGKRGEVLRPRTNKDGYLYCWLYNRDEDNRSARKQKSVHRLVCSAFWGECTEEQPLTDHIDRCRCNNYYKNLRWSSHRENGENSKERIKQHRKNAPIMLYSKENHTPLMRFENIDEIIDMFGLSRGQIHSNLAGRRAPFSIGYFKYIETSEEERNN